MINENSIITKKDIVDFEEQVEKTKDERDQVWTEIQENFPENREILDNVLHVAGGGLPLVFGDDKSEIWQKIVESAGETGVVEIAGIKFTLDDLKLIGEFYNYAKSQSYNFHCIDERLDEKDENKVSCVHEHCGACGAVQALIENSLGITLPVENALVTALDMPGKQKLIKGTEREHATSTIMVTYADHAATIANNLKPSFIEKKALAMNITIPIGLIRKFYESKGDTDSPISSTEPIYNLLTRWNVGIARAVIGGTHNTERDLVGEELLISNYYGAEPVFMRATTENQKIRAYLGEVRNFMFASFEETK